MRQATKYVVYGAGTMGTLADLEYIGTLTLLGNLTWRWETHSGARGREDTPEAAEQALKRYLYRPKTISGAWSPEDPN